MGLVAGMTVSSAGSVLEMVEASVEAVEGIVVVGWVDAGLPQQAVRRKAHRRKERSFLTGDHLNLIISLILRYVHFYSHFAITYYFEKLPIFCRGLAIFGGGGRIRCIFIPKGNENRGAARSSPRQQCTSALCLFVRIHLQRQKVQHWKVLDFRGTCGLNECRKTENAKYLAK